MSQASAQLRKFLLQIDQGAVQRAALAEELADFVMHWPEDCPRDMWAPVTILFDVTLAEADFGLLQRLAARLVPLPDLPLSSCARLFPLLPSEDKRRVLARCSRGAVTDLPKLVFHPDQMIAAARDGAGDFSPELAKWMQISPEMAAMILGDDSALSLAVLCKGTLLGRARFSALSLILFQDLPPDPARLNIFDPIEKGAAMRLTGLWQARSRAGGFHEQPARHRLDATTG